MDRRAASGMTIILLLIGTLSFAFNIQRVDASGTIYIRADGSMDPPTAPIDRDGDLYTLTDNIFSDTDGIVIERGDITLNGTGYMISGSSTARGIVLQGVDNITVTSLDLERFNYGISLDNAKNNTILDNIIRDNSVGLYLQQSSNDNRIYHNTMESNTIQVSILDSISKWDDGYPSGGNYWSDYTSLDFYNGPLQNKWGYDGIGDTPYVIDSNNTDNYPLMIPKTHYFKGIIYIRSNGQIDPPNAPIQQKGDLYSLVDYVVSDNSGIVVERDNITLDCANYTLLGTGTQGGFSSYKSSGIDLAGRTGVIVKNARIRKFWQGIRLQYSYNNTIIDTSISDNCPYGIYLYYASNNAILENKVHGSQTLPIRWGIHCYSSSNNTIIGNKISECIGGAGILLSASSDYNIVSRNNMTSQGAGMGIDESAGNMIFENNYANIYNSVWSVGSSNTFFHNNFFRDPKADPYFKHFSSSVPSDDNIMDLGYPSGGNYWDDYIGTDLFRGPYQNITGSDGIGDESYVIDANDEDSYPLIKPYSPGTLSVSICTDKTTYHAGETMHLGLNVANPDSVKYLCFALWCELPDGSIYLVTHQHSVILPIGLEYTNPFFKTFTLPNLPDGIYTWHVAFLERATHTIIVEDTAEWEFG